MAIIGYARVSTRDQKLDVQLEQLNKVGVERIYHEKASGVDGARMELAKMLDYVREGDTVIVCKLDRVARSTRDLLDIVDRLTHKGVNLRILNMDLDTSTPTGKLMLALLGAIAAFERDIMLERQADGIAKAKELGRYKGRKPTARMKTSEIMELLQEGMTKAAVAKTLKIGIASVYRITRAHRTMTNGLGPTCFADGNEDALRKEHDCCGPTESSIT